MYTAQWHRTIMPLRLKTNKLLHRDGSNVKTYHCLDLFAFNAATRHGSGPYLSLPQMSDHGAVKNRRAG